jgi:molecular chaperone HtpG
MWFGISKFEQQIKPINKMRGIRLRKENIQIGDENTLGVSPKFFKEQRGNCYFIGEVYAVDSQLIPNARRDYFKTNASLKEFEDLLGNVIYSDLHRLYYYANQVKKALQSQIDYKKKFEEYINVFERK